MGEKGWRKSAIGQRGKKKTKRTHVGMLKPKKKQSHRDKQGRRR